MIDSVILNKNYQKKRKLYKYSNKIIHNKIIVKNKELSTKKGSH